MTAAVPPDDLVGVVPMSRAGKATMEGVMRARAGTAMASAIGMSTPINEPVAEEGKQHWSEQLPEHVHGWTPQEEALLARGLVIFGR